MIKINDEELKLLAGHIYELSGIDYDNKKAYLFETRLGPLLDELGCSSYLEFYRKIKSNGNKVLEKKVIDAISTNETLFFRDASPFDLLQHKVLPDLIDARSKNGANNKINLRIWSAACSTGQEVYSIAIVLKELLGRSDRFSVKLLGTDISDAAVTKASYGKYNKFEVERGLSKDKLQKYFSPNGNTWKIKDEIRAMAMFKKMNLIMPFVGLGQFDIVFCRNVVIYFNSEDKKKVIHKIADVLAPDGYLIVGSTESLTGVCPKFVPKRHLRSVYYQLSGSE